MMSKSTKKIKAINLPGIASTSPWKSLKSRLINYNLSSSKAMPNRPSGLTRSITTITNRAMAPLRKAPAGTRKTTRTSTKARIKAPMKLPLTLPSPPRTTIAMIIINGCVHMRGSRTSVGATTIPPIAASADAMPMVIRSILETFIPIRLAISLS